jgi:hypothetical protein
VKKLIVVLSLLVCFNALAQEVATEPSWKAKLRGLITQVAGEEWGTKLLGPAPVAVVAGIAMPDIPKEMKKSTDVSSYIKMKKDPTEFDKLPAERKRQFNYKFLEELFQVTRKTEPKDEDLATWLNALEQGGSREGIYQGLVLDEVYNNLESITDKPTKKLLDYLLKYSQTFHKQTFKPESLIQLNLYSLKRIFTEKGIDLLANYESKDLDLIYRWYALYSAFLAKEYEPMLKTELRKNPSAEFHYQWAKSMPVEHVKSEYIIKMHSVMNQLQLLTQE